MSITSCKTTVLLFNSLWGAGDHCQDIRSAAGAKSRALGSIVLYARAKARERSCSHALRKGYSSPQQPLKTKVETRSNSPVPLKTEDEGCSPLAPCWGLVCLGLVLCHWIAFTNLIFSSPACVPRAENGRTYTLNKKILP